MWFRMLYPFLCFLGLGTAYLAALAIYRLYLSPLRKFPGPRLAAVSRLPFLWNSVNGNLIYWIRDLHERYGEVVRIAPDELSYSTGEAWKEIYHKPTQKDLRFYGKAHFKNIPDMVRGGDEDHARFRRNFSHAFSDRALREQESLIRQYVDLLVHKLDQASQKGKVDLVRMFNCTTFDVMGDLTFGEPLGLLQGSEYNAWVSLIFASMKINTLFQTSRYLPWIGSLLTVFIPKSLVEKKRIHLQNCVDRVDRRLAKTSPRPDIWGLVLNREEKDSMRLSLDEMYANSITFMIAGTETTATLLSGLTYYLLTNPHTLERLTRQIREAFASDEEITMSRLAQLEYLQACLEEGLRMYPPLPIGLPRITPPEGMLICDEMVPGGQTTVSINQWSTYRNPRNFKDPNSFHPERWTSDPKFASDKKKYLQPFSTGPRNCLGKNLANHEMRLVLAKVLWHFDLSLCEECADWTDQKVYMVWEKKPLMVRLKAREGR
ncbi:hypothetical protein VTN77DRAFT_2922 [Rasamsonia byssochlamydoides]|uniref:uncharacterized protein n=1 Tax=Rasamsonia byssochlamydoides TaxID=89139 RepID=UPI0037431CC6